MNTLCIYIIVTSSIAKMMYTHTLHTHMQAHARIHTTHTIHTCKHTIHTYHFKDGLLNSIFDTILQ